MWLLADAYSTGAALGTALRWIVLVAVGFALVRRVRAGAATTGTRIGLAAVVALLGLSAYLDLGRSGEESAAAADRARVDFVAGCVDSGAPQAVCGCMYDHLRSAGIDTEAEMTAAQRDTDAQGVPKAIAAAVAACG